MKKILLSLLSAAAFLQGYGQTEAQLESMMTRRVLSCPDIELNLQTLLPELYTKGDTATIRALIGYAARHCEYQTPVIGFQLLFAIARDSFDLANYNGYHLQSEMRYYLAKSGKDSSRVPNPGPYPDFRPGRALPDEYYQFLRTMAERMKSQTFKSETERKLVEFYSDPTTQRYAEISKITGGKAVHNAYNARRDRMGLDKSGIHLSLYSGVWIPHGNLSILGAHPYIGFQYGGGTGKFTVNLSIAFRFIHSADSFYVLRADSLYHSRRYSSGYFGLDGTYALLKNRKHQWDLLGGVALETIGTLKVEQKDDDDDITKSVYSPNINIGTGYKYWFNRSYIGIDVKYNVLFFRNHGGTDFSGNAFTIGLVFGGINFNR